MIAKRHPYDNCFFLVDNQVSAAMNAYFNEVIFQSVSRTVWRRDNRSNATTQHFQNNNNNILDSALSCPPGKYNSPAKCKSLRFFFFFSLFIFYIYYFPRTLITTTQPNVSRSRLIGFLLWFRWKTHSK